MSNPVITVKNDASIDIDVAHDPDWDDQVLLFNGRARGSYALTKGKTVEVSVKWGNAAPWEYMMGVDFNQANGAWIYVAVGRDQAGNLGITEKITSEDFTDGESLDITYTVSDQAPWSMTMTFTDAT